MENNGQRSKAWYEKKHKRWGGSFIKGLMSEGKKVPKNLGGDGKLKYKWGDKAKTIIFSMYYERITGVVKKDVSTPLMERGLELEPFSFKRFNELYLQYDMMDSEELVDTGFILFPDDDGTREWENGYKGQNSTAGATPDKLLFKNGILTSVGETKARGEDATYSHAFDVFDENSEDFWQVMAQMHACGVNYAYYIHYDDEKYKPWDIQVKLVKRSQMHINKMVQKIKDADEIIQEFIDESDEINTMIPHELNNFFTHIRHEIRNLDDVW